MLGLITGSIFGKVLIALTISVVATATVGIVIDNLGKGKAYERELFIRAEIANEDSKIIDAHSATIDEYKRDLRSLRIRVADFRRERDALTAQLPKTPTDETGIPKCLEICKY